MINCAKITLLENALATPLLYLACLGRLLEPQIRVEASVFPPIGSQIEPAALVD